MFVRAPPFRLAILHIYSSLMLQTSGIFSSLPVLFQSIDFRGITPVEFRLGEDWSCEGAESGARFTSLNLDDEWSDFDERGDVAVSILEPKGKVERE